MNFLRQGFRKLSSDRQTDRQTFRQIALIWKESSSKTVSMYTWVIVFLHRVIHKKTSNFEITIFIYLYLFINLFICYRIEHSVHMQEK